jgi:hypothetical protein
VNCFEKLVSRLNFYNQIFSSYLFVVKLGTFRIPFLILL